MLNGFHVEILLAIFLASPQFSGQYSLFLPSSVSKASTKEQIASKGHWRDINSDNYRGKFRGGGGGGGGAAKCAAYVKMPLFDSCQLITTLMCNWFSLGLPNYLKV